MDKEKQLEFKKEIRNILEKYGNLDEPRGQDLVSELTKFAREELDFNCVEDWQYFHNIVQTQLLAVIFTNFAQILRR